MSRGTEKYLNTMDTHTHTQLVTLYLLNNRSKEEKKREGELWVFHPLSVKTTCSKPHLKRSFVYTLPPSQLSTSNIVHRMLSQRRHYSTKREGEIVIEAFIKMNRSIFECVYGDARAKHIYPNLRIFIKQFFPPGSRAR